MKAINKKSSVPTPIISDGYGASMPDYVAGRVAAAWIGEIRNRHNDALKRAREDFFDNRLPNPQQQRKFVSRLRSYHADLLCGLEANFGTRHRFTIDSETLFATDVGIMHLCDDGVYRDGADTCAIGVSSHYFRCGGFGTQPCIDNTRLLYISRHAVMRAIQRCDICTLAELIRFTKAIWKQARHAVALVVAMSQTCGDASWRVKIEPDENGKGACVIVLSAQRTTTMQFSAVVRTILPASASESSKARETPISLDDLEIPEEFAFSIVRDTVKFRSHKRDPNLPKVNLNLPRYAAHI